MSTVVAPVANLLRKLVPAVAREKVGRIIIDPNHDYRAAIFIGGTGRSGTTWLSELINFDNYYRDMFEPFHPGYVPISRDFRYSLYLRPDDDEARLLESARTILEGRVRSRWVDQANRRHIVHRRLVKEVRANLWLAWLRRSFPKLPIVFVMRHPCAVAHSRVALEWPTKVPQFLAEPRLFEDHLEPFRHLVEGAKTPFLRHVVAWCIHNYVPLRQLGPADVHIVFYEQLCVAGEDEIARLFRFIGRRLDDRVLERLGVPSRQARTWSAIFRSSPASSVDAWRKYVTAEELKEAIRVLEGFGLDAIYNADSMPSRDGLEAFTVRAAPATSGRA